jgi:lactoylglutathione lyase
VKSLALARLAAKLADRGDKSMQYLHTMVRITDIDESLAFFCGKLGMIETHRYENEAGRFTLIFLAASDDEGRGRADQAPLLELTYNWPDENGAGETYTSGRNFGHLAYEVDDIYATCADLQAKGVTINRPPRDGRMAFIKSPDGISIELLQKGEAQSPCEPWASMENTGSW